MPNGGRLTIETANVILDEGYSRANAGVDPGLYVLCGVSDSGVGMDAETASHVFDPFFTTKEKGVGTGLGLATVYGIVKQHQGHVVVQSQQGLGTTFKIYLPLVEEFLDRSSTTTTNQIQLGGSETILVVEDEETVRTLTCEALELLGYCVLSAQESEQAVVISDGHAGPIHLLLTDVILPKMDGRSLYKELASARPDMKVLYMSGYTDNFIVHHGMLDQGVHFLAKPFNLDALARKVRDVLEGNP
jgi:CheY-like chemotaxis protein